jgi:hypothetical protein
MVEADLQVLADDFKKACIEKIQAKNKSHKESQEKNTEEIREAKH